MIEIREVMEKSRKEQIATDILTNLPDWFGIPESTEEYIRESRQMPFFAAFSGEEAVGFLAIKATSEKAAELYVMGVKSDYHHQGLGTELVQSCSCWCREKGYEYLQVKTLDASHPDPYYAVTRKFYRAIGFQPLECIPEVWGKECPCLIMVMHL